MLKPALTSVLLVALLGAVLAVLLTKDDVRESGDTRAAAPGGSTGVAAPGPRPDADLSAPAQSLASAGDRALVTEPQREATEQEAATTVPRAGSFEIVVRLGEGGSPVPGAEVRWCAADDETDRRELYEVDKADALVEAAGNRVTTDAQGRATVPASATEFTLLVASKDGLWGRLISGPKEQTAQTNGPLELVIEHDAVVRVSVIDARGTAVADVSVALFRHRYGRSNRMVSAATNAQGVATFRHVQLITERGREDPWSVGIAALLERRVEEMLELDNLPSTPITLVLPATGRVLVRAYDVDGEPFLGAGKVEMGLVREGEPRELSPFSEVRRERHSEELEGGVAIFRHVAVGPELELALMREGSDVATRIWRQGPAGGRTSEYDIRFGSDHPILVFRAVGVQGAPLAGVQLGTSVASNSQHLDGERSATAKTDDAGLFRVDLEDAWVAGVTRTLHVWQGESSAPQLVGDVDLSRDFDPGLHPLGDIALGPPPLFVSGRVVDGNGSVVPQASLFLRRQRDKGDSWWNDVHTFRFTTDTEGRFEVRGAYTGFAFELGARTKDGIADPVSFLPGDSGLELRLSGKGRIIGSILVDEGVDRSKVKMRLEREGPVTNDMGRVARNGDEFRFNDLPEDNYTVSLRLDGERKNLFEFTDVLVAAGAEVRDPRLQSIDLRGIAHGFRISLIVPDGAPESISGNLIITPHNPGGEALETGRPQRTWFRDFEPRFVSTHPVVDVEVEATGYRAVALEGISSDQTVTLSTALKVTLLLRGGAQIPDPPVHVKAALVSASGSGIDWSGACFDEQREIQVNVPQPGRLSVRWIVERRSASGAMATTGTIGREIEFEVQDAGGQTFELDLSQAEMDELVQALSE